MNQGHVPENRFSGFKLLGLNGKRIIVVGGGGLLGACICEGLVAAGAQIFIADLDAKRAAAVASKLSTGLDKPIPVQQVSIVDTASVLEMISSAAASLGGIDCLVNTAYPRNEHYGRKFENVDFPDFCENVNLHLGGYFLVSQKILEYFRRSGGGTLLNMSSIYGVVAPRFSIYENTQMTMPVEYAAIKAALIHLTKYMAKYYSGNNIRVNSISLGGLFDHQPESFLQAYKSYCLDKGMLDPNDVVGTVLFALSDVSHYMNGQNICVDDGFTL